jgi:hypothetical protein
LSSAIIRYTPEEHKQIRDLPALVSVPLTLEMFCESNYEAWANLYRSINVPLNLLKSSLGYTDNEGRRVLFTIRNAFIGSLEAPIEEVPLYVNSPVDIVRDISWWRLRVGK